ncbi:acyl-CoA dehydrogenase family protein [Oceanomicrobium pacificus]|uniref:3-sulfinopropanoyl-CoA desulfinase n=1 Tax=Oceanomicrobium pacificus TaxID=2692916 RepID=A0A6B0TSX5_9RHOB|nr:acyl-CoA dehydrogenase family protein [Oceanomicrobium pacificus]MXU64364.1 acyl-CoA dehydrogenase [Oceanomicrobium pacificus]
MILFPKNDAETYAQLADGVRSFADGEIRPIAEELDRSSAFPGDLYRQMGELGLFGITVPEELGGAGMDALAYSIVMEELSRGYASVADQCGVVELIGTLLTRYGTPDQQARHLPGVLSAETVIAYCITEEEAGSDVAGLRSTATQTADGWVLNGSKLWIHNAPVADLGFVLARTDPDLGHRGMSIFIVDLNADGVERGPKEHKLGQRASQIGALTFTDVHLPKDALLGELNRGFYIMMSVLEKGRVGIAALATGIAQAGLEAALDYAQQRKQFGKPIVDNQGLQWMLADMAKEIAAARALVRDAALRLDNEVPAGKACSIAKCFASDMCVAQSANALQVFGGSGYIQGFEVERLYRDAKITQIYEGTNQIQRTIIGRELLKNGA